MESLTSCRYIRLYNVTQTTSLAQLIFTSNDISSCLLSPIDKQFNSIGGKLIISIHRIDILSTCSRKSRVPCTRHPLINLVMENINLRTQLFEHHLLLL